MAAIIPVKVYEGKNITVEAYKTASWHNLRIFTLKNHMTSTRIHNEYAIKIETILQLQTKSCKIVGVCK